jgi:hypothetical protein
MKKLKAPLPLRSVPGEALINERVLRDARQWAEANGLRSPFNVDLYREPSGLAVLVSEANGKKWASTCHFRPDGSRDWYELQGGLHA